MAVTPIDILALAQGLATQPKMPEVTARAIIGRAYYAAFHDCKAWYAQLPALGSLPIGFKGGDHATLAALLQNPNASLPPATKLASKKRGLELRALHGDRCNADYDLTIGFNDFDARAAISYSIAIKNIV